MKTILYLCRTGLAEPLGRSQVLPYNIKLSKINLSTRGINKPSIDIIAYSLVLRVIFRKSFNLSPNLLKLQIAKKEIQLHMENFQ